MSADNTKWEDIVLSCCMHGTKGPVLIFSPWFLLLTWTQFFPTWISNHVVDIFILLQDAVIFGISLHFIKYISNFLILLNTDVKTTLILIATGWVTRHSLFSVFSMSTQERNSYWWTVYVMLYFPIWQSNFEMEAGSALCDETALVRE